MLFIFSTFLSLLTFKGEKTVKKENVEEREEFPFEASNLDRRMRKKPKRNENNDSYLFFLSMLFCSSQKMGISRCNCIFAIYKSQFSYL